MTTGIYNGPARYAVPSGAQAEVLRAIQPGRRTHLVELANACGVTVGAIRSRIDALEYKRLVTTDPGSKPFDRNWWVLTGNGSAYRERLLAEVPA